jgi:hypothetical protein
MITNCQKGKKRNNPIHAIMQNFRKNIIYIYIYLFLQRKTIGDRGIQQDRQDTRGEWVDRSGKGTK